MQPFLYDEYELETSIATICRTLKRVKWSRKCVQARAAKRSQRVSGQSYATVPSDCPGYLRAGGEQQPASTYEGIPTYLNISISINSIILTMEPIFAESASETVTPELR